MILMIFAAFLKYIESASLSYRGSDQTLSNLQGTYEFKLWGAQGGAGYNDNSAGSGGKGAYVYGKTHFATKTTLTVKVGGQGASSAKGPNAGGWPNGGKGGEDTGMFFETIYEAGGGGGGSTSLLLGSTQLLVAGAGAGGVMYATGCQGGEFNYHYCSHSGDSSYCDRYAYNNRGNSNGYGGDGVDSRYISGSGGGGGYYGGQATGDYAVDSPEDAMACSGRSYYNPSYFASVNVSSTANSRSGNGYFELDVQQIVKTAQLHHLAVRAILDINYIQMRATVHARQVHTNQIVVIVRNANMNVHHAQTQILVVHAVLVIFYTIINVTVHVQ